jgi:hypothetical protein
VERTISSENWVEDFHSDPRGVEAMDAEQPPSQHEQKPLPPRDVHVSLLPYGLVSVSWAPPASERPIASYRVWSDAEKVAEVPGTQTSKTLELSRNRTHFIQLQAIDTDGNASERSQFGIVQAGSDSPRWGARVVGVVTLLLLFAFGAVVALSALGGAAFCGDNDAAKDNCADDYRAAGVFGGVLVVATVVIATVVIVRAVNSRLHRRHAAHTDWDGPS